MKNLLLSLFLLIGVIAQAGVYSPLTKSNSSTKIIDIGDKNPADIVETSPKIWSQYPADFNMVDGIVRTRNRVMSERESCIKDRFGVSNCPIFAETCDEVFDFNQGSSTKINASVTKPAICPLQTIYNAVADLCETLPLSEGSTVFTLSGTFIVPDYVSEVDICMIGGGGSGAGIYWGYGAKGGKAGSIISQSVGVNSGQTYNIVVGSGGARIKNIWTGVRGGITSGKPGTVSKAFGLVAGGGAGGGSSIYKGAGAYRSGCWGTSRDGKIGVSRYKNYGGQAGFSNGTSGNGGGGNSGIAGVGAGGGGKGGDGNRYSGGGGRGEVRVSWLVCPSYAPNQSGAICYSETTCSPGFEKISNTQCEQNYSYYEYSCSTDLVNEYGNTFQVINEGTDCLGLCPDGRSESCECNEALPPLNNCKIASYNCGIDPTRKCTENATTSTTKKPLEIHEVEITTLSPESFGNYIESPCGVDCEKGIDEIYGAVDRLCFVKMNDKTSCVFAKGCMFEGSIDSSGTHLTTIWTEGNTIKAMDANGDVLPGAVTSSCNLNGTVGFKGRLGPITSFVTENERIKFWNPYIKEGYLGQIEMVRNVYSEDVIAGYELDEKTPWNIQSSDFNHIESYNNISYAISRDGMDMLACEAVAEENGFTLHPDIAGIPVGDRMPYDIVMNTTGGFFNDNTHVFVYTTPPTDCSDGYIYNYDSKMCEIETPTVSLVQAGNYCSSVNYSYTECKPKVPMMEINKTVLTKRISKSGCTNAYGILADESAMWVNYGCRGYFTYYGATCEEGEYRNGLCIVDIAPECPKNTIEKIGDECVVALSTAESRKCVLIKEDGTMDFTNAEFAIKLLEEGDGSFFCSPLTCDAQNSCQSATCPTDFEGTMISSTRPAPDAIDCTNETCDANFQYYEWCGKDGGCPIESPVHQEINGQCYETACAEGGFDPVTGQCYKWQCADGYTDNGVTCVKD